MREKFYRFMQGRYGVDQLYRFIFFLALVLMIINTFLRNPMLNLVVYALLILDIFRMLSKNHSARYAENQKYLQLTAKFRYWLDQQKKLWQERKYHHIYTCPKCKQKIRIPKGKERSWCAARNVILSFRREAKRLCSDILLYTNRN